MIYSPLPLPRYKLHGATYDHVSLVNSRVHKDQTWNLIWLSLPDIDSVVDNQNWSRTFAYPTGALAAIAKDVVEDELLQAKLLMPPLQFSAWFGSEDHSIFDTYDCLGPTWPATVIARASLAHAHWEATQPQREGNVIRVRFGRKA